MPGQSKLKNLIKNSLSKNRYKHSIAVAGLAKKLAKRHGEDAALAECAGLLHDIAKEWSPQKLIRYTLTKKLKVPGLAMIRKNSPNLLHAYVGAHYAQSNQLLNHPKWVHAIASHTLGSIPMSKPDKIIYVADLASTDRKFKEATKVRSLAMKNIDDGFKAAISIKIMYQVRKKKKIHPYTMDVWKRIAQEN